MTGRKKSKIISIWISSECTTWAWQKYEENLCNACTRGFFDYESLFEELGVHDMKITLNLKTLHEEGTQVTRMNSDSSFLTFLKLYTRTEIKVDE